MYSIDVPNKIYRGWQAWKDWQADDIEMSYVEFLISRYPEIKSTETIELGSKRLHFETENHYMWFLLKVS